MKIRHPAVKTNLLKLVGTYELDLDLDHKFPLRLELFRDTEKKHNFRAHVWEFEMFNLEPLAQLKTSSQHKYKTTELIMLERGYQLKGDYKSFKAKDADDAVAIVVKDLKQRLAHWTNIKAR
jgi:hypothetical protein